MDVSDVLSAPEGFLEQLGLSKAEPGCLLQNH